MYMLTDVLMFLEVAVVLFAVARITRLITADEITRTARQAAVRALPAGSPIAYLLLCRWCMSIWVALPAAALWRAASDMPAWSGRWWIDVPAVALALSYATGLLVRAEPES